MLLPFTLALFLGTGCQLRDMIGEVRENGKMQELAGGGILQEIRTAVLDLLGSRPDETGEQTGSGSVTAVSEEIPVSDFSQAKEAAVRLGLCGSAEEGDSDSVLSEGFLAESEGVVCYRMDQIYQGIPVYRHGVSIVTDEQGNADLAAGNYVELGEVDTQPGLDEEGLKQAAERYAGDGFVFEKDQETPLTIFVDEEGEGHLAYLGRLKAGDLAVREILIDAENGEILWEVDLASEAESGEQTKMGYSFYPQSHDRKVQHWFYAENAPDGNGYQMQDSRKGLYLYEGMGGKSFSESGAVEVVSYSQDEIQTIISQNQEPEVKGIQAYVMASMSYDFFREVLGREGFDDANGAIRILYDSAFDGGVDRLNPWHSEAWVENRDFAVICTGIWAHTEDWNLVGHEYTHLVTQYFLGNYGTNAVMEGYSDGFAEMMEAYYSGEDPDWINTAVSPKERKLKPEKDKGKDGSQIYHYQYFSENTEGHDGGTILTNMMSRIWESWRTQEGMDVDTAVRKLSLLLYRTLFLLTDPAEYPDFAEAMDAAAQALERQGHMTAAQVGEVRSALAASGIPFETASGEDVREAENTISLCSIQVLDAVTGSPVEGARVSLLWNTPFLDIPLVSRTTDSLGRCTFDSDRYLHKRRVRISAEGYQKLEEPGALLETYLRPEEQGEDQQETVNLFFIYPEDYQGQEIETGTSGDTQETDLAEAVLQEKLAELSEVYGRVNTEEDYLASGTQGIISQVVPPERLTGVLCGRIHDYDGDGQPELLILRTDGTGYEEGVSNHFTCIDLYLSVYEAEEGAAVEAGEKKIRIPGLPDTECCASFQLFTAGGTGGETIYLDYMLNQNAQCYGVIAFCYEDGVLKTAGGVENTEWPNFAGAYVSDILEGDEGLLHLCGRIYREEGADPYQTDEGRRGWKEGTVYDWTWTEDPSEAGGAYLDSYRLSMGTVLEDFGLKILESRSYLDASSITVEWIGQSCCRRPLAGYAAMEGDVTELCGMISPVMEGGGISFSCYDESKVLP